jgi:hypothetical protein
MTAFFLSLVAVSLHATEGSEVLEKELNLTMKTINKMQDMLKGKIKEQAKQRYFSDGLGKKLSDLCPAIIDHIPNLMQDSEVLKGILTITEDRAKLIRFAIFNITLILASWLWKLQYRMKAFLSLAFWGHTLARFFVINGLRVCLVTYYFGAGLRPLGKYMSCSV